MSEATFVTVDGVNMHYLRVGNPKHPPLVLVHGLAGCIAYWEQNIEALAQNHCLYVLELIGFGESDKAVDDFSLHRHAQYVAAAIQNLGLKHVTLMGHSYGGALSLIIALEHPELVAELILVSSAGFGKQIPISFKLVTLPCLGELLTKPTRNLIKTNLGFLVYDKASLTESLVDAVYAGARAPGGQRALLKTMRSSMCWRGVREPLFSDNFVNVPNIKQRTLILWGQDDPVLPVLDAYTGVKTLPNAKVKLYYQCGHIPQLEHCDTFNQDVLEFLKR